MSAALLALVLAEAAVIAYLAVRIGRLEVQLTGLQSQLEASARSEGEMLRSIAELVEVHHMEVAAMEEDLRLQKDELSRYRPASSG